MPAAQALKDAKAKEDRRGSNAVKVPQPHGGALPIGQPHEPTDKLRTKVEMLAALGNSEETIAFACDFSVDTLKKYYKREVEVGLTNLNHRVGAAIASSALGEQVVCVDCHGDTPGRTKDGKLCKSCHGTAYVWRREPNTTAQVWWSKNRMGWTDRERIEHTGADGGPIMTEQRSSADSVRERLLQIAQRQATRPKDE